MTISPIGKSDMLERLLEACPTFAPTWENGVKDDYLDENGNVLVYLVLGDFARHLLTLHSGGQSESLAAVFSVVEDLHLHGDDSVKEAVTIGLLEAIQNNAEHRGVSKRALREWLGPESRKWWDRLEEFWAGNPRALNDSHD